MRFEQLETRLMLDLDLIISGTETVYLDGTEQTAPEFVFDGSDGPVNVTVEQQEADYTLEEDTALVVPAADGVTPPAELIAGPNHGDLVLDLDGSFIYAPDADWFGLDYFVCVPDGLVSLLVTNVSDLPATVSDSFSGKEDEDLVTSSVLGNDHSPDGHTLEIESHTQPANGTVVHNGGGIFTYTPDADWFGADEFSYVATDGHGGTGAATVTLDIEGVADAPIAVPDAYTVRVGATLAVHGVEGLLSNDWDSDGDALSGVVVTVQPGHGDVTVNDAGAFLYRPDAGYIGLDEFQYTVTDGELTSDPAIVTITITSSNHPIARSDVYISGPAGIAVKPALGVLANDGRAFDVPGVEIIATLVTAPTHGTLLLAVDGSFTYTPDVGFVGADPFTYSVAYGLFVDEARSAFWVVAADMPSSVSERSVGRPPQASGGGSIYDVVLFGQLEAERRAGTNRVLPEYADAVYQEQV